MFQVGLSLLFMALSFASALEPPNNFREGSCSGLKLRPAKASREFVDTLKYISGGARYNLYNLATAVPNYHSMREDEFYYDACLTRNTSTTSRNTISANFGFGRTLLPFRVSTRPGIYLEGTPTNPSQSWNRVIETVTLTDHKNYAFLSHCWTGVDQRSWALVTRTPSSLDPNTIRIIEDHAVSLGFKRENFVFLRYDSCRQGLGNPTLRNGRG